MVEVAALAAHRRGVKALCTMELRSAPEAAAYLQAGFTGAGLRSK